MSELLFNLETLDRSKDSIQNGFQFVHHFMIPEAADPVSFLFEKSRSLRVMAPGNLFSMLTAIQFNDQPQRMTGKVREVRTDRNLSPEMRADHGDASKMSPEQSFRICRVVAQTASVPFSEAIKGRCRLGHGKQSRGLATRYVSYSCMQPWILRTDHPTRRFRIDLPLKGR